MGLFDWLFHRKQRRLARIAAQPFPQAWLGIVRRSAPFYLGLPAEHQDTLRRCIQVFIAEKEFIGCGGLEVDDEIKITIAAPACLLVIGLPELGVFPRLEEVIVHPHDFGEVVEAVGPDGRRYRIPDMRAGEAWQRGPVVLAWDSVRHSVARPCDGYNVVFHEFAHVLDMQAGIADGAPPLPSKEQRATWARVFNAEYQAFIAAGRRGKTTFLDPYGASNPAEFFAVVTEHFFEQPRELRARHRELYRQLAGFFGQDTASREPSSSDVSRRWTPRRHRS